MESDPTDIKAPDPQHDHRESYQVGPFFIEARYATSAVEQHPPSSVEISGIGLLVTITGRNALPSAFVMAESLVHCPIRG